MLQEDTAKLGVCLRGQPEAEIAMGLETGETTPVSREEWFFESRGKCDGRTKYERVHHLQGVELLFQLG